MAFTKITNTELNSRGATTLPNQPTISAAALKQEFDAPAKEIVAPHFNGLIDELEADTAGASIGLQAPSRRTGSTVKAVVDAISQDLTTVEGKLNGVTNAGLLDAVYLKHGHENKALLDTYNQTNEDIEDAVNKKHSHSNKSVIDKWSESAGGAPLYNGQPMTGDMYSGEYDPDSTVKNAGGIKTYVTTGLGTKVDKVDGKGLSTNDFTDALKTKLDNVEAGAEVNVQADYAQTNTAADDYIKNKPTLGTSAYKNSTSVVTDSSDLVESGAVLDTLQNAEVVEGKNLLPVPYTTGSVIKNGITWTVNSDGSVTANGTATANSSFSLYQKEDINFSGLKLSGCPNGGSDNTYFAGVALYNSPYTRLANDFGEGADIPNYTQKVMVYIRVSNGVTVSNLVFKPMISKDGGDYEPYYVPLKDVVPNKVDNSVIAPTENGTTASQAYAVGSHFIRNGAFCTVTTAITSGESLVGSNKFTSGNVASELETVNITNEFTFSTDCTWNTSFTGVYKSGNVIDVCLRFKTPSAVSSDKVILTFPIKYISKAQKLQYPNTFAGALFKTWSGEVGGVLTMAVSENEGRFLLASNNWLPSSEVAIRFSYLI